MDNQEDIIIIEDVSTLDEVKSGVHQIRRKLRQAQYKSNKLAADLIELDSILDEVDELVEPRVGGDAVGTISCKYDITVEFPSDLATDYVLNLTSENLPHGKWVKHPPDQITSETTMPVQIKAESDGFMTGTQGSFEYTSDDSSDNPSTFEFKFDMPYAGSNSGELTVSDPLGYYTTTGGSVPSNGGTAKVKVTITQTGPT